MIDCAAGWSDSGPITSRMMPMHLANDTSQQKGPGPRTLVRIQGGRWKTVAGLAAIWLIMNLSGPLVRPDVRSWLFWLDVLFTIGLFFLVLPYLLGRARLPVFAVREDGIQIPAYQHLQGARPSMRNWRDLGLFIWDRVRACRWSQYALGLLVIQIVASQIEGKTEHARAGLECRIPERDRPAVQEAIRWMGKWAE
jgi:hypothetical protein